MNATKTYEPHEPAFPGLSLDDLCFQYDEGVYGEVCDSARWTRGQAIAAYTSEMGCDFTEVRCVVRYVLLHTRQDVWDGPGKDRWVDDQRFGAVGDPGWPEPRESLEDAFRRAPAEPPADWVPDESMACWSVCRPEHPRAQRAYMCEVKGDERIPSTPASSREERHG